jgi:hypothetical protein
MDTMKSALARAHYRELGLQEACAHFNLQHEKKDNIKQMYIGERSLKSMEETEKEEIERSDNMTKICHSGTLLLLFHRLWLRQCFSLW